MASQQELATTLRKLHIPGNPIVFTNVYDAVTARAVATLPQTRALATASYAIAAAAGLDDDDLTFETNFAAVKAIASVAEEFGLPLTVDLQDGYGNQLEEAITSLLGLKNVVGINLEDFDKTAQKFIPPDVAAERVKTVVAIAKKHDVPDFAVNARVDTLMHGGSISNAIERGRAYLAAGAANVFVLGGSARGGVTQAEVVQLVDAFDGKLNVTLKTAPGNLTIPQLVDIGVARISVGPALQFVAAKAFADEAKKILESR